MPLAIVAGALLIAASILIVGRFSIGHVGSGTSGFTVTGIDTWTGEPFVKQRTYGD